MKTMMFVLAAAAVADCAATPVPADKLARAQAAVRTAEAMPQASTDPRAAKHLQLAKEQLDHAKKLMTKGDNSAARWALMRAEADGEAALYLGHAQAAKSDAQTTLDQVRQAMSTMQQQEGGGK